MTAAATPRTDRIPAAPGVVVVGLFLAAAVMAQIYRDRFVEAHAPARDETLLLVPSGEVLGKIALSFDAVLADVYWIRALQYYGSTKLEQGTEKSYRLLYPLLDIATTLDPQFNIAYRFGAIFLTEAYPNGPGRPDQAVLLLEKGIAANPKKWQYLVDIGFVYYWWLHDYQAAAAWFRRAGEIDGAPWYLESLAANTLALGGDRQASRFIWQQIYESADNDWLRGEARRRLVQLDALDQIDHLLALVGQHAASAGAVPTSWAPLIAKGALRSEPLDPTGTPYVLLEGGKVTVARDSPLFPLPTEPPATPPTPPS